MHDHEHEHSFDENAKGRLFVTMILNFLITIAELIGGILSGSLSLISDALHNFSDGLSIIISYIAIKIARIPKNERYTFGYKRVEILAAVINTTTLVAISILLIKEAIEKFFIQEHIDGYTVFLVATIGLVANVVGTILLKPGSEDNINIRSTYLHLLSDAFSSLAVIIGGILIWIFDIYWLDPVVTILISLYIIYEGYKILKKSIDIIMMKAPEDYEIQEITDFIKQMEGIEGLHHIHYWMLNDKQKHFEAHIEVDDKMQSEIDNLRGVIVEKLHDTFDIEHVTLQFEYIKCEN